MSNYNNPISGAVAVGLGSAIAASIGSSIQQHNVHDESITALLGGVITGAIAGTLALCVPNPGDNASYMLKISSSVLHGCLETAATLTAPLMGEAALHYGTEWAEIIVDELIGTGVLAGAAVGLMAVAGACYGTAKVGELCCSFFSSHKRTPTRQLTTENPVAAPSPV